MTFDDKMVLTFAGIWVALMIALGILIYRNWRDGK